MSKVDLLIKGAFEPLMILDRNLTIIEANYPALDMFSDSSVIGSTFSDLLDDEELLEMLSCQANGDTCQPEIQFMFNNCVYRARCEMISSGGANYLALTMQDVTQLMRLNRARREMVANISHELRAPISTIRLLHETINRPGTGKKQRQSILRKIGRQIDALQRIVDDMHDLSMIESGQALMRLIATPLGPLIDDAMDYLDEQVSRRKLEVTLDVPDDLLVLVDVVQIERVLINLLDNAIKFSPKKGAVAIHAMPQPDDPEMVLVRICDSGPGIPPEERGRVFERFYQLDQARKIGKGSGLGLSIVKHIVEAHNGHVWIKDSDLKGTCMCFTLMNAALTSQKSD